MWRGIPASISWGSEPRWAEAQRERSERENRGRAEAAPLPWGVDPTRPAGSEATEDRNRSALAGRPPVVTTEHTREPRCICVCDQSGGSRHTNRTNSVNSADGCEQADSEREVPTPAERVEEFRRAYGSRARLSLTRQPGQRLRSSLLEEHRTEVTVEPVTDDEDGMTVSQLDRRVPLTWEEAVEQILESYERSRKTTLKLECGYEGDPEHQVYLKDAETSWMPSYQKRYFAELKGWVREAIGGQRPSGGDCEGQFENPHIVLLTRTASSIPDGERAAPVDHIEKVRQAWEPVYHTLRNRLRALGFDSDQWDYYRKEEPHTSERGGSVNRCYTHEHTMLIVDGAVSAEDFQPVLDKHVEECEWAGPDAHSTDRAARVFPAEEVEDVAAYVASYTGIQPMGLLERSIEYVAWAATQWAANRKRRTRSNAAGWAATADACKQRYESEKSEQEVTHGEEIVLSSRRGVELECAECGSPWGIDQDHDTLTSARLSAGDSNGSAAVADGGIEVPDREQQLRERWPSAEGAAQVGELPSRREDRKLVEQHLTENPDASVSEVLGACTLPPDRADLVREVMAGVDRSEVVGFEDDPEWRLDAVIVEDEEHPAPAGDGVDMDEVVMPVERLLNETRLQYHGEVQSPTIVIHRSKGDADYIASHDPRMQAGLLVTHGITEPWAAEVVMEFQMRNENRELASEFEEKEAFPPAQVHPERTNPVCKIS